MDVSVDYKDDLAVYVHETRKERLADLSNQMLSKTKRNQDGTIHSVSVCIGNIEITFFS